MIRLAAFRPERIHRRAAARGCQIAQRWIQRAAWHLQDLSYWLGKQATHLRHGSEGGLRD